METKQQSNPFSTGGGGVNFETRIQAAFTVLMLTGGGAPCLPSWPITMIKLQGRYAGFNTDDFVVFVKDSQTNSEAKLLAQIKHNISITEGSDVFGEVIQAAWNDFNDSSIFRDGTDAFALITGPLSATDINNTRVILEWARHSADEKEFLHKVELANFSNQAKKEKLNVFKTHLNKANGGTDVSDEQLWRFLKSFHLLGYDLDTDSGSTSSLLISLISNSSTVDPMSLWSRVVNAAQSCNQNAGTLTLQNMPQDIIEAFNTSPSPNIESDVNKLSVHGRYIIEGIRQNIGGIHVNRTALLDQILKMTEEVEFVFLTGERGCGKSSLVRQFADYMKDRAPIFCFRTEDFDKAHLDNVFSGIGLTSSIVDLEAGFALMPKRYLIIESIEKLLELQNTAAFTDLIQFVKVHPGWTIIASGRDYAYQQISFNYLKPTGINCSTLFIRGFDDDELQVLVEDLESIKSMSTNPSIKPLLKNPFLADLAHRVAEVGTQFTTSDGEAEFRAVVWRDIISKEQIRSAGMPMRRRRTFIDIAVRRAKHMVYGVPETDFDSEALLKLEEDNLIRRDTIKGLASLAHDVLEDWALERHIDDSYQAHLGDLKAFLDAVGHEPAMNRAFRLWIHQKLRNGDNVTKLIHEIFSNSNIEKCWQDETITAILLGDNPYEFLNALTDQLFVNDALLLKRFCFILRISCKAPDLELLKQLSDKDNSVLESAEGLFLKPYGSGWDSLIRFLFQQKDSISNPLLSHAVAVLHEWSFIIHIEKDLPVVAREAGLLALHLLSLMNEHYGANSDRKKLLAVIIKVIPAIPVEFKAMLESDVLCNSSSRRLPYVKEFCEMSLTGLETIFLCKYVPEILVKVAFNEWLIDDSNNDQDDSFGIRKGVEECFGLHQYRSGTNFFPPSGAKGPFSHLLRCHFRSGLDFIIKLLNHCVEKYAHSDLDSQERHPSLSIAPVKEGEQVEIILNDGSSVNQYCSWRLWGGYRGHTVVPYVLESALMALENWLIRCAEISIPPDRMEGIFDYILRNSNSVITTSVLASVAVGFPGKLGKAALPLLRTPKLYDLDMTRSTQERGGNETDWFRSGLRQDPLADMYSEERRKAALRPWRKEHLEDLIVRLQFSDLRDEVTKVIDNLREIVPEDETWRFRFHRIDSREWEAETDEDNGTVTFRNKGLEPDLEEIQQKTQKEQALLNRCSKLFVWVEKTIKNETIDHDYYANWEEVLNEAKVLMELLKSWKASPLSEMYFGCIVKTATVLLKDHAKDMKPEDVSWCAELVISVVLSSADTKNWTSIADKTDHDGTAAAASILPILLDFAEDEEKKVIKDIIGIALSHANGEVRKSAAIGIRKHLWQRDHDFAEKCIVGAIEYARLEIEALYRHREVHGLQQSLEQADKTSSPESWITSFRDQLSNGEFNVDVTQISLKTHSSWHILNPCLMIPNGSSKTSHVSLLSQMLSLIIAVEESDRINRGVDERQISMNYELPFNFATRFADYVLTLPDQTAQVLIDQLQSGCESAPKFLSSVLLNIEYSSERSGKLEDYWKIWAKLSAKVQEIASKIATLNNPYRLYDERTKLIRDMLHADTPWQPIDYKRQDIAIGKDYILEFVKNVGKNPDVFEAMASLMYHFPTIFFEPGLHLLSKHLLEGDESTLFSGVNTAFYLERSIHKFLMLDNTGPLSKEVFQACRKLLDVIVETASSVGYYTREQLIRSRRVIS